jgi:hypothetical protein
MNDVLFIYGLIILSLLIGHWIGYMEGFRKGRKVECELIRGDERS